MGDRFTPPALAPLDAVSMRAAAERLRTLTKPVGSLGRLETLAVRLAGITGQPYPMLPRKLVVVCAADHGVADAGVSAYPREVTAQMVANFVRGGAAINVLARAMGARLCLVDMGVCAPLVELPDASRTRVASGTRDLSQGPAMDRSQAEDALSIGASLPFEADLVCTGDMGIGNTTSGSAIVAALTGADPRAITGTGTGIDEASHRRKVDAIERALGRGTDPDDPIGVLASVGGFEIAALAGLILGAAARGVPVLLDGLASGAAALIAARLAPMCVDYCIAGHVSAEPAHGVALRHLGLEPLLDLGLRLGEGTGAVLAMPLIDAACMLLRDMATFEEAKVSRA
jgi:nicotinate-nucleotide--dimethylbenzimidazole phosphoribosyltransferase